MGSIRSEVGTLFLEEVTILGFVGDIESSVLLLLLSSFHPLQMYKPFSADELFTNRPLAGLGLQALVYC